MPTLAPFWITIPVAAWLGILSAYDIRTRQIPHSAWVAIPCLLAGTYRMLAGGWALALLALVIVLASERQRLATNWQPRGLLVAVPLISLLILANGAALFTVALTLTGFWLAWELRAWGGADAMTAITLLLLWPDVRLLVGILVVYVFAMLGLWANDLLHHRRIRLHRLPGIPLLAAAAIGFVLWAM